MKKYIDVSYFQRDIDWNAVEEAGVKGVIIKISEGCSLEETWWGHMYECEARGIPWGVYCYAHADTVEKAKREANEVIFLLGNYKPKLGVWYDVESSSTLRHDVDTTAISSAFICAINEAGFSCGIYASDSTFTSRKINPDLLADYVPFWVASYTYEPEFPSVFPTKRYVGWQYSDKEYIGKTNVDMNEWYE